MPANILHSAETTRWGTPDGDPSKGHDIISRERRVMGRIGFDPCSETKFNVVVKADKFLSWEERGEDGLVLPWEDLCHVNPPGKLVVEFWDKMFKEIHVGRVTQAIWVGFAMNQLNLLVDCQFHPSDFLLCYVRKRIPFNRHDKTAETVDRPSQNNYIVGIGVDPVKFHAEFDSIGKVVEGRCA